MPCLPGRPLPDRKQTPFAVAHFRCTNSTPYRRAPACIRARRSTWTIRSCIRWHAPGASSCKGASPVTEQRQTTAKTGPGISLAVSEERYADQRPRLRSARRLAEADAALGSSTSRNSRTGRRFRDTRCRSSRRSASRNIRDGEGEGSERCSNWMTFKAGCLRPGLLPTRGVCAVSHRRRQGRAGIDAPHTPVVASAAHRRARRATRG